MREEVDTELLKAAIKVRENAHAPYSNFKVGAAFRLKNGEIHTGVNVENCALPLSVCAERNAIASLAASGAKYGDVHSAVVVLDSPTEGSPCGACRQVMAEFMELDRSVLVHNLRDKTFYRISLGELLPKAFTPSSLE